MSTPSTTNFNTALHFISSVKQKEVNKQREAYYAVTDVAGTDDLAAIAALPASQQKDAYLGYVRKIVGAITSSSLSSIRQGPYTTIAGSRNLSLHNISTWTALAEKDPHFSLDLIKEWADALDLHVRQTRKKMDCAKLFGELMTEWLGSGDSTTTGVYQTAKTPEPAAPGSDAVAEEPDAARLRVEKERLAGLFFAPAGETPLDTGALVEYLDGLFASDAAQAQLVSLRVFVGTRGAAFQKDLVSSSSVTNAIDGLLGGYSLKEGMRETLEAFRANPAVIEEISSVLTIRMANLDAWEWPIEGVLTEFRTYVTGKLRGFTDPDVIDAILLHYIGTCWQMEFKGRFNNLFNSEAWKRKGRFTPRESVRLKAQLSQGYRPIELQRRDAQQKHFFMNRLADRPQRVSNYDDFLDRGSSGKSEADPNSPATVKRKLLHIVSTESLLQRTLTGKFTVFQSDLADFGPTLSHAAILAVLEYFGMPPAWLSFVKRFLQAPIRIEENGPAQIRQRGIPIGNPLSAAIGEVLLFIMDFAVNQNVEGLFLYRMHDDLWLWDADRQLVARGWEEMQKCAGLLGMKFNDRKTGCATVGGEEPEGDGLPLSSSSRVHWDLMVFDAVEGRFVIDQNEVDVHAKKMGETLAKTKSVLGWVNVYNKYMSFFLRGFGGDAAECLGSRHAADVIDTMGRVVSTLGEGGPVAQLREVVEKRFGVAGLPEGYFYLAMQEGGLEMTNPATEIESTTEVVDGGNPENVFARGKNEDEKEHKRLEEAWNNQPGTEGDFMDFEEYVSLRESWLSSWAALYGRLVAGESAGDWGSEPDDNQSVHVMYQDQLVRCFGELTVVRKELLPNGMVSLYKAGRMA